MNTQPFIFDKKIQVTHIVATVSFIAGGVFYVATLQAEVDALHRQLISIVQDQKERDARQDAIEVMTLGQLRAQLERMETKLDRLVGNLIRNAK